jgi:hypothetical protein
MRRFPDVNPFGPLLRTFEPEGGGLKSRAQQSVEGGLDKGVVANIRNTSVLSATW